MSDDRLTRALARLDEAADFVKCCDCTSFSSSQYIELDAAERILRDALAPEESAPAPVDTPTYQNRPVEGDELRARLREASERPVYPRPVAAPPAVDERERLIRGYMRERFTGVGRLWQTDDIAYLLRLLDAARAERDTLRVRASVSDDRALAGRLAVEAGRSLSVQASRLTAELARLRAAQGRLSAEAVYKIADEVHSMHRHEPGFDGLPTLGLMLCLVEQGLEKAGVKYEPQACHARRRRERACGDAEVSLMLQPMTFAEAAAFVDRFHRHHRAPVGYKFCMGVSKGDEVVGVAIVGRPVARGLDDGWTLEVTRVCVTEGHKNAASMLYGACWRAARALGYKRLITYTLASESGTSLVAAGWTRRYQVAGRSWSCPSRPRVETNLGQKTLWESAPAGKEETP